MIFSISRSSPHLHFNPHSQTHSFLSLSCLTALMAKFSSLKNWARVIAAKMKDYDNQRLKEAFMKYEAKVFKNSVATRITMVAAGVAFVEYAWVQVDHLWFEEASERQLLSRANAELLSNKKLQEDKARIDDKMLTLALSLSELNRNAITRQREAKPHLIGGLQDLLDDMAAKEEEEEDACVKELKCKATLKLEALKKQLRRSSEFACFQDT